jgi:hypothetical protein
MLSPDSKVLAAQIQATLSSGDFVCAEPLINTFVEHTRIQFEAAQSSCDRQSLLAESLDYLNGWLHLSRVVRSHVSWRLHTTIGQSHYRSTMREGPVIQLNA